MQNRAIFSRSSREIERSVRQINTSGWIPISRSCPTECCVGLVFSSPAAFEIRHERQVDVQAVLLADVQRELPNGFQKGLALDIADGAADLGDHDIRVVAGHLVDHTLDLVGDVRNHLHGLAQELARAVPFR